MRYSEVPPAPELSGLVQTLWTLDVASDPRATVEHVATPDGCVEVIHRLRGRSSWGRAQPRHFVAGLIDRPAHLRFSGDAMFVGLRLWPWTWHALGGHPCRAFANDWRPLRDAMPAGAVRTELSRLNVDRLAWLAPLVTAAAGSSRGAGRAILAARRVSDLAQATGRSARTWQRWFARAAGMPPQTFLRLIRFQETMRATQQGPGTLADHAAGGGFADQAHMAREFRRLAGDPPTIARRKGRGPFIVNG